MVFIDRFYNIIVGVLLFVATAGLAIVVSTPTQKSDILGVHFIDVGQGDGIFIETPTNRRVLIDGGKQDSSVAFKIGGFMPFYDKRVDVVIATHADSDHIGGLIDVLDRFEVGALVVQSTANDKFLNQVLLQKAREKQVQVREARAIQNIIIGEVEFEFMRPTSQVDYENENQKSVVVKMVYKNDSFLFTGDIDNDIEMQFIQDRVDVSADVLKVAHHGSKSSSNELFIQAVNPNVAVVQAGKDNSYGHPHAQVLERLNAQLILRNDQNGTISLYSDGDSF